LKLWPIAGLVVVQILLGLAHWFLYGTWSRFWGPFNPALNLGLAIGLGVLACSFVVAALLSFRSASRIVSWIYWLAAVWLGFLNFLFWAACVSWLLVFALGLVLQPPTLAAIAPWICTALSAAGVVAGLWGMVNARWIRVRRVPVKLADLPDHWRGRKALVLSDLHLGHINGVRFAQRVVQMANELEPDVVFIPGDLFDGGQAHIDELLAPFHQLKAPQGIYFSSGNHDEFGDMDIYTAAIERAGIRVLANQATMVDGLAVIGIGFGDSNYPVRMRALLQELRPDPSVAAVLLNHVPTRLPIAEEAGIGLQLSGHTHAGQIFPFTWITRRVFGRFTHGLAHYGAMAVYTSTGAGAWGPPMRVGTEPEMVLISFEAAEKQAEK
jgi:hypothetical protein